MSRRTLAISLTALLGLALVGAHFLTRVEAAVENPSPMAATERAPSTSPSRRVLAEDSGPVPPQPSTSRRTSTPTPTTTKRPSVLREAAAGDPASTGLASRPAAELPVPYEFSKDGIRGAIEEKLPEIRECYEAWRKQNPGIEGRLLVGFDIAADNSGMAEVQHIELVDGGVGQPFMEGCVLNAFQDIRFEEPPGGGRVKVRYPIELGAGGEDAGAR